MFLKEYNFESKNIPLIYTSTVLSGMLFFLPVLALYIEKSLFSATNVALVFSIEAVSLVAFEIPTGAVADLFGRKLSIVLALVSIIISLIFLSIGGTMLMFALYAILNGLGQSLSSGSDSAIIYDTLKQEGKEKYYKKIIGINYTLWPLGASIGSILGGYLASFSYTVAVLSTFIPLILAVVIFSFVTEPHYQKEEHKNVFKISAASFKFILERKQLLLLLTGGFILWGVGEALFIFDPFFFEARNIPIKYFGYIFAAIFALSSLGNYFSHNISEKFGNKFTLILTLFFTFALLVVATYTQYIFAVFLVVLTALMFGLRGPIIDYLVNIEIESNKRATVNSIFNFVSRLGYAVMAPLFGFFVDEYKIINTFRIGAFMIVIVPLLFLFIQDKK